MSNTNHATGRDGHSHSGHLSSGIVPLVLLIVFFGGVAGRFFPEIYPIANWAMFAQTPSRGTVYALRVHALNGKPMVPPRLIKEVPELRENFVAAKSLWQIEHVFKALESHSHAKLITERNKLEALFGKYDLVYEPLRLTCDHLRYARDSHWLTELSFGKLHAFVPLPESELTKRTATKRGPG